MCTSVKFYCLLSVHCINYKNGTKAIENTYTNKSKVEGAKSWATFREVHGPNMALEPYFENPGLGCKVKGQKP